MLAWIFEMGVRRNPKQTDLNLEIIRNINAHVKNLGYAGAEECAKDITQ